MPGHLSMGKRATASLRPNSCWFRLRLAVRRPSSPRGSAAHAPTTALWAEAFASLWDWGHFRPIDGTRAHPANAFIGLRLNIAPDEAFVSLWDWGHFRLVDETEAHPDDAFVGLGLNNAPETASRSAPGQFFHRTQAHAVRLRLSAGELVGLGLVNGGTQAHRSWDSGSRIGRTQAHGGAGNRCTA